MIMCHSTYYLLVVQATVYVHCVNTIELRTAAVTDVIIFMYRLLQ